LLFGNHPNLSLSELAKAYESNNELTKPLSTLKKTYKISSELNVSELNELQPQINQLKEKT
jgi:hypothetical protein